MIPERFDLAVVGASFAGLSCATEAVRAGCSVCVLDAKPRAGARPHTTGLLVQEAAEIVDVPADLVRKIPGVRLYAPNLSHIDLDAPGYHFLATDLPPLLDWFARRATAAGVDVRFSRRFVGGRRTGDGVELHRHGLSARYLVGADGARSAVAHAFRLGRNRRFLVGLEHEYTGIDGVDPDRLHVFIDRELAPGYIAWVIPGVHGVTQVGLAGTHPTRLHIEGFLTKLQRVFDLRHARRTSTRAGLIPVGGRVHPAGRGDVLLLGDAAGSVSPLTAGGIHKALELGSLAGRLMGVACTLGTVDPVREMQRLLPRYRWKGLLRHAAGIPFPNAWIDAMLDHEGFRAFAQLIFFHHRGLFSRCAWRDLRRLALDRKPVA